MNGVSAPRGPAMTCREFTDFIVDHFDGKLPKKVAEEFDDHLAVCPDCRTYLQNYRRTVDLVRSTRSDAPIPDDVPPELVDAVLVSRRRLS
jgi:anti-sigma factor RsiW